MAEGGIEGRRVRGQLDDYFPMVGTSLSKKRQALTVDMRDDCPHDQAKELKVKLTD